MYSGIRSPGAEDVRAHLADLDDLPRQLSSGVRSTVVRSQRHTDRVRQAFAHEAVLLMEPDADVQAPGAAITAALCGHWDHQPPCPLAAHHNQAERVGDQVHLRTLFATDPDAEPLVRQRIDRALSAGHFDGPDLVVTRWHLDTSRASEVTAEEADHADRLTRDYTARSGSPPVPPCHPKVPAPHVTRQRQ